MSVLKKEMSFFICLLYLESCFGLLLFDNFLKTTVINIFLLTLLYASLLTIITSIFTPKINKLITYLSLGLLGFIFSLNYIFKAVFASFFSISIFGLTNQIANFGHETIMAILENSYALILFFLPLILAIIFHSKLNLERFTLKQVLTLIMVLVISACGFGGNLIIQKDDDTSAYALLFKINDHDQNIEKLGLITATGLDITRTLFGFDEQVIIVDDNKSNDDVFTYDYNILDLDLEAITSSNNNVNTVTTYLENDSGTEQNKYTGLFEGMNLIYITAESFSEIGVSKELTPTLYQLVTSGFDFTNFYSPVNLSTIGGEFQSLTGLFANNTILATFRSGRNAFPYGLGTIFKEANYHVYAYHNHTYTYQDRNKYLQALGFDYYKACGNGIETVVNCKQWPRSDQEMIDGTVSEYVSSEPFMVYYMTNSGHMEYNWSNAMARKHKEAVADLPYSEEVKAYLATQIELDQALESLIKQLDEAGVLNRTIIVLQCDHYPYALSTSQINEVSTYQRDAVVEINHNNLIIWNPNIKHLEVTKVASSIDVIPTVYNLFGLKYDSRLFAGKDIFSNTEGLAFFTNRSWVTNKGTYLASSKQMISNDTEIDQAYIDNINSIVANRINISKLIISTNYYQYLQYKNN